MRHVLLVVSLLLAVAAPGAAAEDAALEEALVAAGANRPQLERVLAHFEGDPPRLAAARFLVANMPGKGYIRTQLRDREGVPIPFDPLHYADFKEALAALEAIEAQHGEVDFARDEKIEDVLTIRADFLIRHVDLAFAAWERMPADQRVGFEAFLEHVLPYRGSEEPLDTWLEPLMQRYAARARPRPDGPLDAQALYRWLAKDVHQRLRFDERYYLHPTDQSFTEMGRSGQGRCEDITNMLTFAARSLALATAADYTPFWAHRDNNHAWNVLLDQDGRGADEAQAHAAKVYRKTFAIQRDSLPFHLPAGREAPNRFLASTTARDVTDQYAPTTDVTVTLDATKAAGEQQAYLCVFNGGAWQAIHWGTVRAGRVTFDRMGRNVLYLPAVHDGTALVPAAPPLLVARDGTVTPLPGLAKGASATATSVRPVQVSPDTLESTPVNHLVAGATYLLRRWDAPSGDWQDVRGFEAGAAPARLEDLAADGLYWLVQQDGKTRRLERPWTVGPEGTPHFW